MTSMSNLAGLLNAQGRLAEAESLFRKVLKGCEAKLGARHPNTVNAMQGLVYVLEDQRKFAEAEQLNRKVMEARQMLKGIQG